MKNWGVLTLTIALLVSGCSQTRTQQPQSNNSVVPASPIQNCGQESNRPGETLGGKARECLWDVYEAGKPAELTVIAYTIEGDPITYTIRVHVPPHGTSSLPAPHFVLVDNKDRFGKQGVYNYFCLDIERRPYAPADKQAPNLGDGKYGLTLRCIGDRGADVKVHVP